MLKMLEKGDVIQFNENHKWRGCFGIVDEIKAIDGDVKYIIALPLPTMDAVGIAYIFVLHSENALERIGKAVLTEDDE